MKQRPSTDVPTVDLAAGRQSSASREQVLGRLDQLSGNAEYLAEHVRRAPGRQRQRRGRAEQTVGGLVDRAVAAEGHDHVIALVRRLAAQLGGVTTGLGVDRVNLEPTLQGVDDEMAQAVGNSRRVRVDDDQHAPLDRLDLRLEVRCRLAGRLDLLVILGAAWDLTTLIPRLYTERAQRYLSWHSPLASSWTVVDSRARRDPAASLHPSGRLLNFPAT